MKEKSIKINMLLNGIKGFLGVLFPLISFPYVSKILGAENIGKYNFVNSVISYFALLAALGINIYAVREGSKYRDNKEKLNNYVSEIFTINIISTIISYLILFLLVIFIPKLTKYSILILILSSQIIFQTIGIEWMYSIYEDYKYITIRSIIFQLLSLLLLFLFVKSKSDLYIYAFITVISGMAASILNFIYSRRYCKVSITKNFNFKKHMKPILIFFATTVTISIYVNSDITILGFLTSDYNVGIYSVSTKIYTIIKSLLASIVVVSIPRFSALLGQKRIDEFKSTATDIYKTLLTLIIPAIIGIIVLSREIILIISDITYIDATYSLILLSIAMFFCLGAYFWGQAMLIPLKKENIVFKITVISAIVNIVLNLILIPIFKENAAALTTIIAEAIAFIFCKHKSQKIIKLNSFNKIFIKSLLGSIPIVIIGFIVKKYIYNLFLSCFVIVTFSIIAYILIEILLKNEIILDYFNRIYSKIKKNKGEEL